MPVDPNLGARFYIHPALQGDESAKAGRQIYKDVVYVEIFIKGAMKSTFSRPMREGDKEDFPSSWKAFRDNNEEMTEGTPLKFLPGIGPSAELEFKAMGIRTIEDLANLAEMAIDNIRGGRTLKKKAIAYLAAAEVQGEPEPEDDPVDIEALKSDPTVQPVVEKRKYTKRTLQ